MKERKKDQKNATAKRQAIYYVEQSFQDKLSNEDKHSLVLQMDTYEKQNNLALIYATNTFSRILENPRPGHESYLDELELERYKSFLFHFNEDKTRFTREYIIEIAFMQIMYAIGTNSKSQNEIDSDTSSAL